jgi:hypothetical protein
MSFAGKWMELEIIMLSDINQAQKSKMSHVLVNCGTYTSDDDDDDKT